MVQIPNYAFVCDCQGPSRCGRRWLVPAGVVCWLLCLYYWMLGMLPFLSLLQTMTPFSALCSFSGYLYQSILSIDTIVIDNSSHSLHERLTSVFSLWVSVIEEHLS